MNSALMVILAAAPTVASIDAARAQDFAALRVVKESEDPALLAAYLRYLGRVSEPESVDTAKALYARLGDPALKALAVTAIQPKLLGAPDDLVPFLAAVFVQEQMSVSEPVHLAALKKLVEIGTPAAAIAALRYEAQSEPAMLAQLDALMALRAQAAQKIGSFAKQHMRSPRPKVAEKAKALAALISARRSN